MEPLVPDKLFLLVLTFSSIWSTLFSRVRNECATVFSNALKRVKIVWKLFSSVALKNLGSKSDPAI
uniref:Uncharacterized protein n=1 Tax=Meloidogyne enterolobii TaxID=390850 RepID=A0A6V7X641_MELEN|nr:unnamed protein product [Meloidogyne enterolobii]